jgi:hypothetical protein
MKKRNLLLAGILGLALVVQPFAVMAEGEDAVTEETDAEETDTEGTDSAAVTYTIEGLGISIDIPEEFVVAVRGEEDEDLEINGVSLNEVDFDSLGLSDEMAEIMKESGVDGIWLIGQTEDAERSININVTDGLGEEVGDLDADVLEELAPQLAEQLEDYGMENVSCEVYENQSGVPLMLLHNSVVVSGAESYNIQYQFYGADHVITITYGKASETDAEDEAAAQAIAESLIFED